MRAVSDSTFRACVSLLAVITATLIFASPGQAAGILYGLSSRFAEEASVYRLDEQTGRATFVTHITNHSTAFVGLEFLRGTLYATDVVAGPVFFGEFTFGKIDLATGAFTAINNQTGSINWHGLAASQAANLLYTVDIDDNKMLKSITPSGIVTSIGTGTGVFAYGLAYDDANDILYATSESSLYRIDTRTGTSTLIGALGEAVYPFSGLRGLAMDEVTRVLYMNDGFLDRLYTVDVTTGAATLVGPNGITEGFEGPEGIDGLAWSASTPEPDDLLVVGAGVGLFMWAYRVRRRTTSHEFRPSSGSRRTEDGPADRCRGHTTRVHGL